MNMNEAVKQLKELAQGNAHPIAYRLRTEADGSTSHKCEMSIRTGDADEDFHFASENTWSQALANLKDSLNAEDGLENLENITDDLVVPA